MPASEVGELCLRGPHVSNGLLEQPRGHARRRSTTDGLVPHRATSPSRDEDGFYYIAGRKKDMIISGGVNVYPAEIEAALAAHPGVADSAVVGVPHDTWGEVGVAFVVRAPGTSVDG